MAGSMRGAGVELCWLWMERYQVHNRKDSEERISIVYVHEWGLSGGGGGWGDWENGREEADAEGEGKGEGEGETGAAEPRERIK